MDKIERLINLTAFLLYTEKPRTFEELKGTVYRGQSTSEQSLRRMFERDKEELRSMGIEVDTAPEGPTGEATYIIPRDSYYLPRLDLDIEERVALTMVSRLFLGSGTPFSAPAHTLLLKLAFDSEGEDGDEAVPHVHWVEDPREAGLLASILEGLTRRKLLRFSYRALDAGEPAEREVEPYGLFNRRGHWYLVGLCHLRGEIRCFKLDRMVSEVEVNRVKPRTRDFEVPEGFDVSKEASWEWPLPLGEEDVVARVRFRPRLAFAHASGRAGVLSTERRRDGCLDVTYEVADPETFVEWTLSFGGDAVILHPPELREMARERLKGVLEAVAEAKR